MKFLCAIFGHWWKFCGIVNKEATVSQSECRLCGIYKWETPVFDAKGNPRIKFLKMST